MCKSSIALVSVAALPLALSACQPQPPKQKLDPMQKAEVKEERLSAVDPKNLMGVEWRGVSVRSDGMLGGAPLTITFGDDGRVTGFGGVNRFSGPYTCATGVLHMGPLVATKMAGEPARMAMEQRLFDALSKVDGFSLQSGLLRLKQGEQVLAEFSR